MFRLTYLYVLLFQVTGTFNMKANYSQKSLKLLILGQDSTIL